MATTDKYDRQLRLWGASGQRQLGNTLVVLIGSSSCGTETLKNLVLPGVGSFLIIDDDDDGGHPCNNDAPFEVLPSPKLSPSLLEFSTFSPNFFTSPLSSCEGDANTSKASSACALLSELNPDAIGFHYTTKSLETLDYSGLIGSLLKRPLSKTSSSPLSERPPSKVIVIAADQPSIVSLPLSRACHLHSVPVLFVRSYGLLGWVRVQTAIPYHCIVESKPSHRIPDLRLSSWPLFDGLKSVLSKISDLDAMEDSKDHSHVPFVIILLQALEKWRTTISTPLNSDETARPRLPESLKEKESFKTIVRNMTRDLSNEMNFEEAIKEAHLVWTDGKVSEDSKDVLKRVQEDDFFNSMVQSKTDVQGNESGTPTAPSHVLKFQLMALALKRFLAKNNDYPPLQGTIPDMTSDTARYVALQEAYQQQADKDRSKFRDCLAELLKECHQKASGCDACITMPSDDELVTFCKNARHLRILETRPFYLEYQRQDPVNPLLASISSSPFQFSNSFNRIQSDACNDLLFSAMDPYETDPTQTPLIWWIALRACEAFFDRHQHYPGKDNRELALESDSAEVYKLMCDISSNLGMIHDCDLIKATLLDESRGKDFAREVVRYDEAEIHPIAAVIGGVASQEAVKLITGQYVPLDDTYVFNGIASTAGVYRF